MHGLQYVAAGLVNANDIGIPKVAANNATIASVMSTVFLIVGGMALLFMLIGAARFISAGGEPAKITQARNTLIYAAVGVIVSALGFTVVQFVAGKLTGTI